MATVKPRIKLDKKEAKKGELVEVKALVQHVMETGNRRDADGKLVPRKILNKFVCTVAGKQVFAADFETAISANPFIPHQNTQNSSDFTSPSACCAGATCRRTS